MQYLLSRKCRPILARIARERTLCAFDFDGTLAPIVEHPRLADMRGETRRRLETLTTLYPCMVLSGRARADVAERVNGLGIREIAGCHGADNGNPRDPGSPVPEWKRVLDRELGRVPGMWLEDKHHSLAVHYRQAHAKARVRGRILTAARRLPGARVLEGKQVVDVVDDTAPHKGTALAAARHRLGCDWALYVGDDKNDEDAFALEGNVIAVRVGRGKSHAQYYLRNQSEIDDLLGILIELRQEPAPLDQA